MGSQNAKAVEYLATEFIRLPATFIGHRIFVQPVTSDDVQLTFYTDTGGGGMFIEPATVHRLGLPVMSTEDERIASESVAFPAFHRRFGVPILYHGRRLSSRTRLFQNHGGLRHQ